MTDPSPTILALPGVVHLLRAIRDAEGDVMIEAWSLEVLRGETARCALTKTERHVLASFLLEGL